MKNSPWTIQEIRHQAQSLVGKTFKEIKSSYSISAKIKGSLGQIIEDGVFSITPNSNKGPDFKEVEIELKVTPLIRLRDGKCSAKERLVLNIINYMNEVHYEFETSSFWIKNKTIEIIFYEYVKDQHPKDYQIVYEYLHEFSSKDLMIIRADWETIVNKIKSGLAHELSEGDTMYLGAVTKGANNQHLREQPYSDIKAMQRAFSLKTTYMTKVLRQKVCNQPEVQQEELISEAELKSKSFEEIIRDKILLYKNESVENLIRKFQISTSSKSKLVLLVGNLLGIRGQVNQTDEFQKANIQIKTIRLNLRNQIKESMSFPAFKYEELVEEDWETSNLRSRFVENKYLFVVFKELPNGDYVIWDAKFWNMKPSDLDGDVQMVWEDTKQKIKNGEVYKDDARTYSYHFLPKSKTSIIHVRPHGQNRDDTYKLPVKDKLTGKHDAVKMCFFLNNDYILRQIRN